jgi:hypothetical protein
LIIFVVENNSEVPALTPGNPLRRSSGIADNRGVFRACRR